MAADPLLASLVAVIVAVPPSATSVTRPVCDTVAIVGALDTHATVRPVSGLPLASLSVAVSCTVPPTGMAAEAGLTATVATHAAIAVGGGSAGCGACDCSVGTAKQHSRFTVANSSRPSIVRARYERPLRRSGSEDDVGASEQVA